MVSFTFKIMLIVDEKFAHFVFIFHVLDTTPVELTGRVQVLENGDLLISNVRESDAGWYNCIRSNEAGSVTGQAYLGVMGMLFSSS